MKEKSSKNNIQSDNDSQSELDNFEKVDIEILVKQNKSLFNEINRMKGLFDQNPSQKSKETSLVSIAQMKHKLNYFTDLVLKNLNLLKVTLPQQDSLLSFIDFLAEIFEQINTCCKNPIKNVTDFKIWFNEQTEKFENFINFFKNTKPRDPRERSKTE